MVFLTRPGVGLPSVSTVAWTFVLNPPLLRPIAWSSPSFLRAGAVLMRAHDGCVDHGVFIDREPISGTEEVLQALLTPIEVCGKVGDDGVRQAA